MKKALELLRYYEAHLKDSGSTFVLEKFYDLEDIEQAIKELEEAMKPKTCPHCNKPLQTVGNGV